jgi:putative Ca2+/H+ antiporter (TMEM165/GDT1 family)
LTAGLVVAGRAPVPVFVGAWLGLITVAGAAVLLGRVLLRHVRLAIVRYIGAAVCAALGVVTLLSTI